MAPDHTELVRRNEEYAANHQAIPTIAEIEATGAPPPKTCIVTCVDPRVFPEKLLGLRMGEAFLFRSIAGHPQPIFNQILALDIVSHGFEDLILVYHTDCGASNFTDSGIQSELCKLNPSAHSRVGQMAFGAIATSIEQSIREDIKWLKDHPLLRKGLAEAITGYVYDLKSGKLLQVE